MMNVFVPIKIKETRRFGYHRLYSSMVRYENDMRFHARPRNHGEKKGILLHVEKVSRDINGIEKHRVIVESEILKNELKRIIKLL